MTPAELAQTEPDTLRALAANPRVAQTLRNEARRALDQAGRRRRCADYTGGAYPSTMKARPTELARRTFSASW